MYEEGRREGKGKERERPLERVAREPRGVGHGLEHRLGVRFGGEQAPERDARWPTAAACAPPGAHTPWKSRTRLPQALATGVVI
jgi:hypothetical protein